MGGQGPMISCHVNGNTEWQSVHRVLVLAQHLCVKIAMASELMLQVVLLMRRIGVLLFVQGRVLSAGGDRVSLRSRLILRRSNWNCNETTVAR